MSSPGTSRNAFSRLSSKISIPMTTMATSSCHSCIQATQRRCYSSNSDLPPHQEIGMPSLSPTMTEGNIARWLKKEGEKVSPGEVLCEIETDKATVEMECMEEGYIAKIIQGDGAQNIKVGEPIAITVEEEDDIGKFKDYKTSASSAPAESKPSTEPTSPAEVVFSDLPPHQEIGMPSLSPTMTEGNIARWLKKEGDKVSPGEVLCEIETDKATVEMECMEDGYIAKIIQGDGAQNIKVGEPIAITVEEEEDIGKFKEYKASASSSPDASKPSTVSTSPKRQESEPVKTSEPKVSRTDAHTEGRIFSSPAARKLAEDNNVPLSSVKGTGPDGQILKSDIEDYLASSAKGSKVKDAAIAQALSYTDIPNSQIRKVTSSRLLLSKQTLPHYYLTVDTRVDKLMELRSQLNSLQEASSGKRISINDLVIKAAAMALRKVPACNCSWMNDFIRQYQNVNINVAVQTDNGLFVPVIRDADKKGLSTIADEVKSLAQKAKDNSLKPEDYEGGTFTISNLGGPFGVKQFCAIINPPQSGILAVGSAERRVIPGAGADQFELASFMSVTLSCDHRVIDGAIGAEWLKAFKGYIENPSSMLL
ncbi:dihydrolipoyllysine-residue acetyltransferase component 2 of pyruvate dehydrogenase complex, mitochondrial-like [Asparagus officinalis]|uniref:dihydrolipoyllysine-residue acetyltransferase component 2 of pyruvate dehydrogenase complex, mitochondrial-like n=1 Tax=Asparagus officinalis TaxID=4686 RepID=UPI00098E547B|nr:dihydrolipoyllysine-residue acetyltransferase component 2 of pyruvate dehydrogenase complex, mitochondrial-like [Asparagus officinalis]